jgi:hypothetical protein
MQELFVAFLQNPTVESFQAIRDAVVNHPKYDGYSQDLRDMETAFEEKRFADVKTAFGQAQPNLLLSPGAHLLLSLAMREEGNTQGADLERFICFRCMDGIQLTGDGTKERPFLVLRTSDEYDLLSARGKQLGSQHLVHEHGKSYDQMVCADASELWFDITDMFGAMARRMNDGGN